MIESIVVSILLVNLVASGAAASNVPGAWVNILNPNIVPLEHDMNAIATYYNQSLTSLGTNHFTSVSFSIETFPLLNMPSSVVSSAEKANNEIGLTNVSLSNAVSDFAAASKAGQAGNYALASSYTYAGCISVSEAQGNMTTFENITTPALSRLGLPVSEYAGGEQAVNSSIAYLSNNCRTLTNSFVKLYPLQSYSNSSSSLQSYSNSSSLSSSSQNSTSNSNLPVLTISSPQTTIETGGVVSLSGNLTTRNTGVPIQVVKLPLTRKVKVGRV